MELPPQRFSRPSQSTARAAHHSFALDCAALVLLTRMQDRRNRPLCHPSETVSRRSFKPTVLFAVRTWRCCSPLVHARLRCACLADSYARPSQSTAALTHPKLFPAGLSNLRFCSLFAPDGAAHHSFALDCAALVLLSLLYYFLPVFAIMLYYIQTGER